MSSANSKVDKEQTMGLENKEEIVLPFGSSHWDRIPNEIKAMVFSQASPLTQFLNGRLKSDTIKNSKTIRSIWTDAFDIDWQGDFGLLPEVSAQTKLTNTDLAHVRSRSMYERLCMRFPEATETNTGFAKIDIDTDSIVRTGTSRFRMLPPSTREIPLRLLNIPMRRMWLDVLGDTLDKSPYVRANDCIVEGHTEMLRHLIRTGKVVLTCIKQVHINSLKSFAISYAMDIAAAYGHLDIVKYLHKSGCQKATKDAMDWAAFRGHLDVVKWLHGNRAEGCTTKTMDDAAGKGRLKIVKWLHENRTEGCTTNAMDAAAKNGRLDVVKFLHENRTEGCTTKTMDDAAGKGRLKIVKWLHENRTEGCTTKAMDAAAGKGRLKIVKWLHENRTEGCTTKAMDAAAKNGHLDVIKWLHENRTEGCTRAAMDDAAKNGHLDVVEFLHKNRREGCTKDAMDMAATNGHLEIFKLLHENRFVGCTTKAIDNAVYNNHPKIIRFILENRYEEFTEKAILGCKTAEIAEMLVSSMSLQRKRKVLARANSKQWYGPGIDAIRKSLDVFYGRV